MNTYFNLTNKKILITGATGFIGGAVARRLLEEGHAVRALARPSVGGQTHAKAGELSRLGAEIVRGDILERNSADILAISHGC